MTEADVLRAIANSIDEVDHDAVLSKATSLGFLSHEEADESFVKAVSPSRVSRDAYVHIFGPTKGDKVHLGDTGLIAVVERDLCAEEYYGDEVKFGGGKVIRDGMGQCSTNYDSSRLLSSAHRTRWILYQHPARQRANCPLFASLLQFA